MGFLNPVFLLAGLAVAVPVFLHLFYRRESKTFAFPAIRYLLRTERERARQIRTQQVLLLLIRVAVVAVVVLMGARTHFPGPGKSHDATALALVIDNSLSATAIEDGRRRLDALKAVARRSAEGAGPDDVIWVIRAGTPWLAATPGNAAQALAAIDETPSSHGRGDLLQAAARARALVAQSDLPAREVHLITDLQATAFAGEGPVRGHGPPRDAEDAEGERDAGSARAGGDGADVPIVVFGAPAAGLANRGIEGVVFGGGLAPLAGRRTEAAVSVSGGEPGDTVGVRLYVGGLMRGAARAPAGATVRVPAGPFPAGRVEGWAEIDPDPLTADDRHYFSFAVRDPTPVAVLGDAPLFVQEAAAVLAENGRIAFESPARAATLVSAGGEGLDGRSRDQAAVAYPLADPVGLPALNRRLAEAGIPFRYVHREGGGLAGGQGVASRRSGGAGRLPLLHGGTDGRAGTVGGRIARGGVPRRGRALQRRSMGLGRRRPVRSLRPSGVAPGRGVQRASRVRGDGALAGVGGGAVVRGRRGNGRGRGGRTRPAAPDGHGGPRPERRRAPGGRRPALPGNGRPPASTGPWRATECWRRSPSTRRPPKPTSPPSTVPTSAKPFRESWTWWTIQSRGPGRSSGPGADPSRGESLAALLLALVVVESGVAASTRIFSRPGQGARGPTSPARATPRRATPVQASSGA